MPGIGIAISPHFKNNNFSFARYWATLISATVEDAAPRDIIMTYGVANTDLVLTDFTVAGYVVQSLTRDATNKILTLHLNVEVLGGETPIVTFVKTGGTANVTNNVVLWYLAGGIAASAVVGAYKATGATSKAASLVNIANPGTNDLTEFGDGSLTWDSINGWGGFADTKYLQGPNYLSHTYSVIVRFYNPAFADNTNTVFYSSNDAGTSGAYSLSQIAGNVVGLIRRGTKQVTFPEMDQGVVGNNATTIYINGVSGGDFPANPGVETNLPFILGAAPDVANFYMRGWIRSAVVYNTSLTEAQMIAVQNKMKADSFIVKSRDFSALTRYASNPIINYNTNAWNSYGVGNQFFKLENKIGNTYYGYVQAANGFAQWWNLITYTSTDLVNWTAHAINPAISNVVATWEAGYVIHPTTIKIGNTWYMYYSAIESGTNKHQIGLATSTDLVNWTKHAGNPVYSAAADAACPSVIKIGSVYYLYYWDQVATWQGAIHYATSADGITWAYGGICIGVRQYEWLFDKFPLDPWVIRRSDGIYEMMITRGGTAQQLGYAASYDGIHWHIHNGLVLEGGTDLWDTGSVGDGFLIEDVSGDCRLYYSSGDAANEHTFGCMAIL